MNELTDTELELFEIAFLLKMPLYQLMDMPYDEFVGWCSYFKLRAPGWREDYRAYLIISSNGAKVKPGELFPSLERKKKSEFKQSAMFFYMQRAVGGDKLEFEGEVD